MMAMIDEATLDALVDEAVAPYEKKMSPAALAKMRIVMRLTLEHHPGAAQLTAATVPHKEVDSSSEVAKDGAKPGDDKPGRASGEKE